MAGGLRQPQEAEADPGQRALQDLEVLCSVLAKQTLLRKWPVFVFLWSSRRFSLPGQQGLLIICCVDCGMDADWNPPNGRFCDVRWDPGLPLGLVAQKRVSGESRPVCGVRCEEVQKRASRDVSSDPPPGRSGRRADGNDDDGDACCRCGVGHCLAP